MRSSKLLIPTLREAPSDAEVISHQLMVRAGFIRKLAAGIYSYLPLCLRVLRKIEGIIREEMVASGAQELLLPIVMPAELWMETGRWQVYGKELLRFKDRHDRDFCIGPTHEEAITDLLRHEVKSYRDLPKNCFQIQTKFRDEIRPRFGLMRGREFIMKDGYSFDRDREAAIATYHVMHEAYKRIFTRCGLDFRPVEAMTGAIGGSLSHEFQVLAQSGEDAIICCSHCEYAANSERAEVRPLGATSAVPAAGGRYQKVATPGLKAVDEVANFLKVAPTQLVKTMICSTDRGPIGALVRGDRVLNEAKLKEVVDVAWCHLADEATVVQASGGPSGFAGPIGRSLPIFADLEIANMADFVVGANEADAHFVAVSTADFTVQAFADIRYASIGDRCARCTSGVYQEKRGIEVGQVFYLGTKYSDAMNARYLDESGEPRRMEMGCYGIGIGRTAAAAIEQNHDERGIVWPLPIAPFQAEIIALSSDDQVLAVSESLYASLIAARIEVLFDDRDQRPGVKLADADLIGIPYQIIIGTKGLKERRIELKERKGGNIRKLAPEEIVVALRKMIDEFLSMGKQRS